ncbi:MAG: type II secretion system F family protein [Methylophilaceae bacterium]|nr:type II secretion system F family protein [Methylophilaceae bacterium]
MQFQLRVLRDGIAPTVMRLEAATPDDARRLAEQQGFTVLRVQQRSGSAFCSRAGAFPLLLFCQELKVLLEAGLPLSEVLHTLAQKENKPETRETLSRLHRALNEGRQFSDALSTMPQHFPSLFVASVRACETTGNLPEGLARYSVYLEQVDILRKRIVSASIYPSLVLVFGGLVLLFLLGYVVPRFSKIYESRSTHLSFASEILMEVGQTVEHHGMLMLALLIASIVGLVALFKQPAVRAKIGIAMTHLPQIGSRIRVYHLSRLYRTLAMLLRSGVPVVTALGMVNELLGHALHQNVALAQRLISEGRPFSEALTECGLTTPVALQLFRAGEKSGRLDGMMEHAADFHEEEMLRWVDAFTKLFEPILMAAIGVVIGVIVLLMYLPIFELASGIR